VDEQLGFSELLQGILGLEKKILSGCKDIFHFAMKIDELEELLEQDDIRKLHTKQYWFFVKECYSECRDMYISTDTRWFLHSQSPTGNVHL
jgi:hypothetical protein